MAHYRVPVNGRNFWLRYDTGPKCLSFYTVRFMEAATEIEAESAAVELVKRDPKLAGLVLNESTDPPMIHVGEIDQVEAEQVPEIAPGFSFYPASQDAKG